MSSIYRKTAKGQSEIDSRVHGLSMQQRRVLILVNGSNDVAELKRMSLCEDVAKILEALLAGEFIDTNSSTTGVVETRDSGDKKGATDVKPADFMCNTLLTFANRVRVGKLIEQIESCEDIDSLKELIKPWYQAIAETPGGMYQADDLRDEVFKMIGRA